MENSESSKSTTENLFRTKSPQVYGIATYDALFKHVLSDNEVRPSFFHSFLPGLNIISSQRLDEHMNPVETFQLNQLLRDFFHKKEHNTHIQLLAQSDFEVVLLLL